MDAEDAVGDEETEVVDELRPFREVKKLKFKFDFGYHFLLENFIDFSIKVQSLIVGDGYQHSHHELHGFLVIDGPFELIDE